jgi:hypothetical protein
MRLVSPKLLACHSGICYPFFLATMPVKIVPGILIAP